MCLDLFSSALNLGARFAICWLFICLFVTVAVRAPNERV